MGAISGIAVSDTFAESAPKPLRILHVLRAPVGGLFRHVSDLIRGQSARGHEVGVVADSSTGGQRAEEILHQLRGSLALRAVRLPMPRHLGLADAAAVRRLSEHIRITAPDVIHGHGAKGAAYARLASAPRQAIRVYTPHGGSLHYGASPVGLLYLLLERALMPRTDLLLFESEFGRDAYRAKIGLSKAEVQVIHNGLAENEFEPVSPRPDAADVVFVGELRMLKGIDVLIEALVQQAREGRTVTATIVGDGPDRALFESQAQPLGGSVSFTGALPAREAFTMGRVLVVPSRAESLPYIVLEAAAAGIPMIATRVGGIPEILGPQSSDLIPPADPAALGRAIISALDKPEQTARNAAALRQRVRTEFSQDLMVDAGLAAYRQVLAARRVSPGG